MTPTTTDTKMTDPLPNPKAVVRRDFAAEGAIYRERKVAAAMEFVKAERHQEAVRKEATLRDRLKRVLNVEPDAVILLNEDQGELEVEARYGDLTFTAYPSGMLALRLSACPQCGHGRSSMIGDAVALYWAIGPEALTDHVCPTEPEDWLINQEVRETEISAGIARRMDYVAAQAAKSGLAQLVDEIQFTPLEEAAVQLFRAVQTIAAYQLDMRA